MTKLVDAVAWKIERMREEFEDPNLTDAARMESSILVQLESIRALIIPTAAQLAHLDAVEINAAMLSKLVRQVGPDGSNPRIRKTFEALVQAVNSLPAALQDVAPSELGEIISGLR